MMKFVIGRLPFVLTLLSILCASEGAQAQQLVVNGGFETRNALGLAPKNLFINVRPDPWTITQAIGTSLAFICDPGTADTGPFLSVYGTFPTSSAGGTSTAGGKFLMSDGDPDYSGKISQTLPGLANGQMYEVSFLEAGGQQKTYLGPTTEKWRVTLGNAAPQFSTGFSLPQAGVGQWHPQTMYFTPAQGSSLDLEFYAVGTPGGQPPICFLDNVSVQAVPEPASLAFVGIGLLGSLVFRQIRRRKSDAN